MATKKKPRKVQDGEPVEVRKITIEWPSYFAQASVVVAVKPGTSSDEGRAMASTILRTLIMQDSLCNGMPEGKNPDAKA